MLRFLLNSWLCLVFSWIQVFTILYKFSQCIGGGALRGNLKDMFWKRYWKIDLCVALFEVIKIQKQFLAGGLTWDKAVKVPTAMKTASRNSQDLHLDNKDPESKTTNQVHNSQQKLRDLGRCCYGGMHSPSWRSRDMFETEGTLIPYETTRLRLIKRGFTHGRQSVYT